MKLSNSLLATALGFGLLSTGCIGSADDLEAAAIGSPSLKTLNDPGGGGGVNKMLHVNLHEYIDEVLTATDHAVLQYVHSCQPSPWGFSICMVTPAVNPAIVATGILDTPGGREVFTYALRCALDADAAVVHAGQTYYGGGIMATTASWAEEPLTTAQKEDLFACMIAHVNPEGIEVPFFLTGPSVNATTTLLEWSSDSKHLTREAYWIAKVIDNQTVEFHAWSQISDCPNFPVARACGDEPASCDVVPRDDAETACPDDGDPDTIDPCDGRPTLVTYFYTYNYTTMMQQSCNGM